MGFDRLKKLLKRRIIYFDKLIVPQSSIAFPPLHIQPKHVIRLQMVVPSCTILLPLNMHKIICLWC